MRMQLAAAVTAAILIATAEARAGFAVESTHETFGEMVEDSSGWKAERRGCWEASGAAPARCEYEIAGRPVTVHASQDAQLSYVRIVADAADPDALADLVDLTTFLARTLDDGLSEPEVRHFYSRLRGAVIHGRRTGADANSFRWDFSFDETGNLAHSVFRPR